MLMDYFGPQYKAPDYKKYKAEKFEKNKQKVLMLLNGIKQTSLKEHDKEKLISEIKKIVNNY